MAPMTAELSTLRSISYRISSSPTSQLPQQIPSIAAKLAECKTLLSANHASAPKTSSEASVAVHKYRTLLATLLQDRTIQGRWAAIVLIKATIEIGGWETLQKCLPWVRGLLGILAKPDPPSSKKLCIVTLTRIFVLTREYPTLVREITTPSLPTFVQTCLQLAPGAPATLLQTVLESFNQLLPRHPTIFRSYLKQLNPLLAQTIAPTPSSKLSAERAAGPRYETTVQVSVAARQLYTQLPNSAPKGTSSEEWQAALKKTVGNAHRVADKVFRAVIEDWKPSTNVKVSVNGQTLEDEVQDLDADSMALPPWSGIFAGGERLVNLLRLAETYLLCATAGPVNVDLGAIADLLTRLLSLNVPSPSTSKDLSNYVRFNNQVGQEERENLWSILPEVHVAAIEVLLALSRRGVDSSTSFNAIMLDQLVMLFSSEKNTPKVRTACYLAVAHILGQCGVVLPKSSVEPLGPIIRACCDDILLVEQSSAPSKQNSQQNKTNGNSQQALTNADTFLSSSKGIDNPAARFEGLQEAAHSLLTALFSNIPHYLSDSLRTRMDRTAILTSDKDALLASCLNVASSRKFGKPAASMMPLLARLFGGERDVEALIRPRMPVIRTGGENVDDQDESDESEESEEEDGSEPEEAQDDEEKTEPFVGHELDTLLETATREDGASGDIAMGESNDANSEVAGTAFNGMDLDMGESESRITAKEDIELSTNNKRAQETNAPLSPTKRVKMGEGKPLTSLTQPLATPTVISSQQTVVTLAPSQTANLGLAEVSTSQGRAALPQDQGDPDSDEEDIVPLVFGQDTDDESE
ncbi:hypothetical protein P280DRAFT_457431 [Massarina eburnea CBS 473.64]|uniref:Pre-rRNA-processing protein RIX1 n=1 Tax=Massarina eburnea CBS 473.64 TaxID=1395130 RepID=A0A6A6RQS8_9PLEO|nr:hypothetical protein P280DRAFT_457431 [Massarina eburnea CBS 473.64]